jgi:hypothetical protein
MKFKAEFNFLSFFIIFLLFYNFPISFRSLFPVLMLQQRRAVTRQKVSSSNFGRSIDCSDEGSLSIRSGCMHR